MITAEEFKIQWDSGISEYEDGLIPVKTTCSNTQTLPEDLKYFLINAGLPDGAAPFLSFNTIGQDGLKHISQVWGTPKDYSDTQKERLSNYLIIGSDGCGNPITIDIKNNYEIIHIDHDDFFKTITFMNSSINQLASFLLCVRAMIKKSRTELSDTELDSGIPISYKNELMSKLDRIDPKACEDSSFWKNVITTL